MKIDFRDYVKHPITPAEIMKMARDGKRVSGREMIRMVEISKMRPRKGAKGMRIG